MGRGVLKQCPVHAAMSRISLLKKQETIRKLLILYENVGLSWIFMVLWSWSSYRLAGPEVVIQPGDIPVKKKKKVDGFMKKLIFHSNLQHICDFKTEKT